MKLLGSRHLRDTHRYPSCPRLPCPILPEVVDVDQIDDLANDKGLSVVPATSSNMGKQACGGNLVIFPPGKNQHTSYPFGLHNEQIIPWNYHSINESFYLQARSCTKEPVDVGEACAFCDALKSTSLYDGIIHRMEHGVHENTPLAYHGVGGLVVAVRRKIDQVRQMRLTKLNTGRKLLGKSAILEDHKQWILAVASGRVDRVASLVQAGLAHHVGVRGLIQQYERAANKLYKPKGYTEEDIMRSIVMLRLGGARVAEFAHRSLSLPSVMTIRRNTIIRPLIVSPSWPTVAEVETNITSCFDALSGVELEDDNQLGPVFTFDNQPQVVLHQVLMLDELAVEKRLRWDDLTDKFQGTCREHNAKIPLTFSSERELDMLCDTLDAGEVHLASEVCLPCQISATED
jgi:hypothetical protein